MNIYVIDTTTAQNWQIVMHKKNGGVINPTVKYELHWPTKTGKFVNTFLRQFMVYYDIERNGRGLCEITAAPENRGKFISAIHSDKPRYLHDQLILIWKAIR